MTALLTSLLPVLQSVPASAAGGDVLPAGTQYCADSYSGHPNWFGSSSSSWVVDINFPGDGGTTLIAPGNGSVAQVTSGYGKGYGNSVVWTSQDGSERLHLAHLASVVTTGSVAAGTPIGVLGTTGDSSSPHLHLSRSVNGSPAPVVLSGVTVTPYMDPAVYGRWPCNGTTYTAATSVADRDGDGTPDASDRCPDQVGPANTSGCPDGDGDAVADLDDNCPVFVGPSGTRGCPPEDYDSSFLSDFDGNGRTDVAAFYDYGSYRSRGWMFNGAPDGLADPIRFWDPGDGNWNIKDARFVGGDFNGDARSDVAAFYDYGDYRAKGWVFTGTPSGLANKSTLFWDSGAGNWNTKDTRFVGGDFNGDGRTDVAAFYDYGNYRAKGWLFAGTPSGLADKTTLFWDSGAGNWNINDARFVSGDFDADGRTDVAAFYDYGNYRSRGWMFNGAPDGLADPIRFWDPGDGNWDINHARFVGGDFNGDARTDVAAFYDYGNYRAKGWLFAGTPTGLANKTTLFWDSGAGNWNINDARFVGGDFNGDARTDVAAFYDYGNYHAKGWLFAGTPTGLANKTTLFWDSGAGNWNTRDTRFVGGAAVVMRLRNTAVPTITGTPRVDGPMTASPGTWSPAGSYSFQWLADGAAIAGATGSNYTPTTGVMGQRISVQVTVSRTGYPSASATSEPTEAVAPGIITNNSIPTVRGKNRVGKTLTASAGSWSPDGLTVQYQWLRDGKAIKGATTRKHKLTKASKRHRIRVRVTVSKTGYTTASATSAQTSKIKPAQR